MSSAPALRLVLDVELGVSLGARTGGRHPAVVGRLLGGGDHGGMPTLAALLLALITDQPLLRDEKWEVARHILRLICRRAEAQGSADAWSTEIGRN